MNRILLIVLLVLGSLPTVAAQAGDSSSTEPLRGQVRDVADSTLLSGVHVINLTSLQGTVTGPNGEFSLPVKVGDRMLISHLGYELDTMLVTALLLSGDLPVTFYMLETTYLLSIFKVLSIETFEEFERAFMALELPEDRIQLNLPPPGAYQKIPENAGFTIAIPFDLSYFSKKAKDLRKYKAMLEKDEHQQLIYARYNPYVVEKVTGMRDEVKIRKLMDYCSFSEDFIINSIDYDLYVAILQCYQTYQGSHE